MKITYYTILTTEHGQAIQCARCNFVSYNDADVAHRYCAFCKLFLGQLEGPLPPLTLAEFQIIYNRIFRFLAAEQEMRKLVFPEGHTKRRSKLTAVHQAIVDLVKIKDVLKQQFAIAIADPEQRPAEATQPPLLEIPTAKPAYH